MDKDSHIRIRLSTEAKKELKIQAVNKEVTMSELVRQKLQEV